MAKEISSELLNTILTRVGGPGNIASCGNCMTRLRLGVHDSSLVDPNIKTLEGVKDENGKPIVHGIFASVPYCIQLLDGPYVETDPRVIAAFRPKSARRETID